MTALPSELLTDRYQFTMADSYLAEGTADGRVAFELFVRELPPRRGYPDRRRPRAGGRAAGRAAVRRRVARLPAEQRHASEALCERLATLRFDGDLDAVPEGTAVVAGEPLLRVEGVAAALPAGRDVPAQPDDHFQTLIATKAARMVDAAAGRPVVDFGLRRAHGADAGVARRPRRLPGRDARPPPRWPPACCGASRPSGTMAHSYVMGHESELEAFSELLREHPRRRGAADRHLRHRSTAPEVRSRPSRATGIASARRCGSTPATSTCSSREVREVLDAGGLGETAISASGDLDEYVIAGLVAAGAPIDGVRRRHAPGHQLRRARAGRRLQAGRERRPAGDEDVAGKATLPGRHQVFRTAAGDVIGLVGRGAARRPLLEPVLRAGQPAAPLPTLADSRSRAAPSSPRYRLQTRDLTQPVPSSSPALAAAPASRSSLT